MVFELVMLKGRVLLSWIPWWTLSVEVHVLGMSGAGWIMKRWVRGLMDSIG